MIQQLQPNRPMNIFYQEACPGTLMATLLIIPQQETTQTTGSSSRMDHQSVVIARPSNKKEPRKTQHCG